MRSKIVLLGLTIRNCLKIQIEILYKVRTMGKFMGMGRTEQKIRFGVGSAAAAAAIFAPLEYKWKGVLTGVAAASILTAVYGIAPFKRLAD